MSNVVKYILYYDNTSSTLDEGSEFLKGFVVIEKL